MAFTLMSIINLTRMPFFLLPFTVTFVKQYQVTFTRVEQFLLKPDITNSGSIPADAEHSSNLSLRYISFIDIVQN
jgi:hypothetical protein